MGVRIIDGDGSWCHVPPVLVLQWYLNFCRGLMIPGAYIAGGIMLLMHALTPCMGDEERAVVPRRGRPPARSGASPGPLFRAHRVPAAGHGLSAQPAEPRRAPAPLAVGLGEWGCHAVCLATSAALGAVGPGGGA